jgi:hypothetical protein
MSCRDIWAVRNYGHFQKFPKTRNVFRYHERYEIPYDRSQTVDLCQDSHRLDPNDTQRIAWFNLEALTLL